MAINNPRLIQKIRDDGTYCSHSACKCDPVYSSVAVEVHEKYRAIIAQLKAENEELLKYKKMHDEQYCYGCILQSDCNDFKSGHKYSYCHKRKVTIDD
jgi:hypothetical protein